MLYFILLKYFYITITFDQCNAVTYNIRFLVKKHRILSMKEGRAVRLGEAGITYSHGSQQRPKAVRQEKTNRQRLPAN